MADRRGDGRAARRTTVLLATGQLVCWGALYYAFAVVMPEMRAELGWSTALLSAAFSVGLVVSGVLAPTVGGVVDRAGARRVMTGGSVLGGAGLALWAAATHPVVLLAAWVLIGAAMAATLYEPAFATLVREHPSRRRTAILTVSLTGALASPVFSPVAAWAAQQWGWRPALLILAAAVATTGAAHAALPASQRPPTPPPTGAPQVGPPPPGRQDEATRTVGIGVAASAGVATAANAHLIAALLDAGRPLQQAIALVAAIGVAKVVGRIAVTPLVDRGQPQQLVAALLAVQALGLAAVQAPGGIVLALPLLFGGAAGAMTIVKPLTLASIGDAATFARRSGRIHRTATLAKAAAPFLLGAGITWAADYQQLWWTLPATLLATAALLVGGRMRTPGRPAVVDQLAPKGRRAVARWPRAAAPPQGGTHP